MAYAPADDYVGAQPITTADDVAKHQLGLVLKGADPVLGMGKFMYLQNATGGAVGIGATLLIDERTGATAGTVAASRGPIGVAMANLTAGQYGWFQVEGVAVVQATTAAANAPAYVSATAGVVLSTVVAGQKVDGAVFKTANGTPAVGQAYAQIALPCANGNG